MNKIKFIGREVAMFCARFRAAIVVGAYFLAGSSMALADLPGLEVYTADDVTGKVICEVAIVMFWVLMSLSIVFVLVAAYQYLTSGGDAEKVKNATKTITYAAVAIAVALLAKGFPFIIGDVIGFQGMAAC